MGILDAPGFSRGESAKTFMPRSAKARVPKVVACFTFDDASVNDYTVIRGILAGKGIKGGFAIPPDFLTGGMVNGYQRMTWTQLQTLYADGHEVLPHSNDHSHLSTFADPDQTEAQVIAQVDNKAVFAAHGIATRGFVYPFGEHDALLRRIVRDYFEFALATVSYEYSGSQTPLSTYTIRRISLRDDTVTADHYAQIDTAIAKGEMIVFFSHSGHELEPAGTGRQRLADVIQYCLDNSVPVVTPSEAFDMVRNVVDTGDYPGGQDYFVVDGQGTSYAAKAPRKLGSDAGTTVSSATAVTLTRSSNACQIVTGSFTQSLILPSNVKAGHMYVVINKAVGNVSVRSYDGGAYTVAGTIIPGSLALVIAVVDNPNAPLDWTTQLISIFSTSIPSAAYGIAVRDANANLSVDALIEGSVSTTTVGGTTTLTVDSVPLQIFTGTNIQTVALPTTSVTANRRFTIMNRSTQSITVNSSSGAAVTVISAGASAIIVSAVATPTASADWIVFMQTNAAAAQSASTFSLTVRDGQSDVRGNSFVPVIATVATAGGTTTLIAGSAAKQFFTGASNQTVVLPTTSVVAGKTFEIVNKSSGTLTVNSSAGNLVKSVAAGARTTITALQATPTADTHWDAS